MRISNWYDYEIVDASCGEKLERWNNILLIRPDPQIIWKTPKTDYRWNNAHAHYQRSNKRGGRWNFYKQIPNTWFVNYKNLRFNIMTMGFKHTGVFPEQATNWDLLQSIIKNSNHELNILNLFAYTGGATLACAEANAKVCHVDSSKGMVNWAKQNAIASGLSNKPIRWIVDDCIKFVNRESKRGIKYDGIIMDPPSYGRGVNGEVWKLEDNLFDLINLCTTILSKEFRFFMVNSYTTGISTSIIEYILYYNLGNFKGRVVSDELGMKVTNSKLILPCGSTSIWIRD